MSRAKGIQEFEKPEAPKKANGTEFRCTIARHLPNLRLQGMWAQVERLTQVASFEKKNAGKPHDQWTYPVLFAAESTLADACNVAYNTARDCVRELVSLGLLSPRFQMGKKPLHLESGRWQTHDYDVTLHDDYAQHFPCAPFRFCRQNGRLIVKAGQRKIEPGRADRFFKKVPQDVLDLIVELRNSNKSFQEIGDELKMNKGYVHRLYTRAVAANAEVNAEVQACA